MLLKDWLERERISVAQFAERIQRTPEAVRRYVAGERIPDRVTMPLVIDATSRSVMPNDFFGVAERAEEVAA